MATHSSILAWRIPRTEEPGGLQSMGLQRVGRDWAHMHLVLPLLTRNYNVVFLSYTTLWPCLILVSVMCEFNSRISWANSYHWITQAKAQMNELKQKLHTTNIWNNRNRGWDGWMASPTQWTWAWANSRGQWRTGNPGTLQSLGSQRVGHNLATKQYIQSFYYVMGVAGKGAKQKE